MKSATIFALILFRFMMNISTLVGFRVRSFHYKQLSGLVDYNSKNLSNKETDSLDVELRKNPGESPLQHSIFTIMSPTSYETFIRCPQLFKYKHIDRLRSDPSPEMVRGSLVHAVLNDLYEMPAENRTIANAQAAFLTMWGKERVTEINANLFRKTGQEKEWGLRALELLENYFSVENPEQMEPLLREERLNVKFGDKAGGIRNCMSITGILDRLDQGADNQLTIVDYKTGNAPVLKYSASFNEQIIKDKFRQLKVYALMMKNQRGETPSILTLIYLGNPVKLTMKLSQSALNEVEQDLWNVWNQIHDSIENDNFPTRKSKLCDWCSHKSICPAFN